MTIFDIRVTRPGVGGSEHTIAFFTVADDEEYPEGWDGDLDAAPKDGAGYPHYHPDDVAVEIAREIRKAMAR